MMHIQPVLLHIPSGWNIQTNRFLDLEPDNILPIDDVHYYFDENLLHATYEEYLIDLGFYGTYLDNRNGFFRLYVVKGNFQRGQLYESFISRSTLEIKNKLNYYFGSIYNRELDTSKGYSFNDESGSIDDYTFYSVLERTALKLTTQELYKLMQPKSIWHHKM